MQLEEDPVPPGMLPETVPVLTTDNPDSPDRLGQRQLTTGNSQLMKIVLIKQAAVCSQANYESRAASPPGNCRRAVRAGQRGRTKRSFK